MFDKPSAIAEFWDLFERTADQLSALDDADGSVYDALLAQLHRVHRGLYLEFCAEPGACELIITADGDRELFPWVESTVANAPIVEGWTICALKPRIGFPVNVRWEDVTVNISDVVFDPLERKASGDLGLRVFIDGLPESDVEVAHNAILRALDHGLGERRFAERVAFTEVRPLPSDKSLADYIQLTDLERYIESRKSKRSG